MTLKTTNTPNTQKTGFDFPKRQHYKQHWIKTKSEGNKKKKNKTLNTKLTKAYKLGGFKTNYHK